MDICGFGSGPDEIVPGIDAFVRQIKRDTGQATANGVVFVDTHIFGDGRVAGLMTKTAISFTLPGEKKADTEWPVHDGDEKHREPVEDRAVPFCPSVRRAGRGTVVSRGVNEPGVNPLLVNPSGPIAASAWP